MSMKSWREEFYPVRAFDCDEAGALDHSIKKWLGLRPENLARHDLIVLGENMKSIYSKFEYDRPLLGIDGSTCALCKHYVDVPDAADCAGCPLYLELGCVPCDSRKAYPEPPYRVWIKTGDPEPMIDALLRAKAVEENENGKS